MARYALMNPGKYNLGTPFTYPPLQNRTYNEDYLIKKIKWKTSCLLNRRVYVGNVKIKDKDNIERIYSDSIFKSKSNKFDTFTLDRRIDVAVGDGDEIVKLTTFADRILQFKENTLHIINATENTEYLEATHKFKGVSHPSAVCTTDYGIAWCNRHGAFFYDGQRVSDITSKEGIKVISDESWSSFYVEKETMLVFVPDTMQLLFVKSSNSSTSNIGDVMIYNIPLQSWTKSTGRLNTVNKTNLTNIWDGIPAWGEISGNNVTVYPWEAESYESLSAYKVQTKELNFGNEAKKKITKVKMTYKGGSSGNVNILPKYSVDGGPFDNSFYDEDGVAISNIASSASWKEIELFTSVNANNVRTFAVELAKAAAGNVVSDFEINDMTIIFRQKSIK